MRHSIEKIAILIGLLLTLTWPMLLGGILAGREGIVFGGLVYVVFGALFLLVLVFGGIRGILDV